MTRKLAATLVLALTIVGLTATVAFAHQNQISGVSTCNTQSGEYDITWANAGDPGNFGDGVIFSSSRAAVATGQTIPRGQTVQVGTESVPGTTTSLTLSEVWRWPSGFKNHNSGSIELGGNCIKEVRNPKATAVVRCIDFKPNAEFNLGNSGSNVDITFDISINGSVVRSETVVAGTEQQVTLPVHEGDELTVTVGDDVLAFTVVEGCEKPTPTPTPSPTPPPTTPPTTPTPPRGIPHGTANTGFTAGPAVALLFGLLLLAAISFYLRISRKGQAYMDRAFKTLHEGK